MAVGIEALHALTPCRLPPQAAQRALCGRQEDAARALRCAASSGTLHAFLGARGAAVRGGCSLEELLAADRTLAARRSQVGAVHSGSPGSPGVPSRLNQDMQLSMPVFIVRILIRRGLTSVCHSCRLPPASWVQWRSCAAAAAPHRPPPARCWVWRVRWGPRWGLGTPCRRWRLQPRPQIRSS